MIRNIRNLSINSLALPALMALLAIGTSAFPEEKTRNSEDAEWTLVQVNITLESHGISEDVVINGKRISGYKPKIIHIIPSTGVVMDEDGHVLTFLGYRWVDLHGPAPRIDLVTHQGEKYKGRLIGIDQNIGVAVIKALEGSLKKTPLCLRCEIRSGITVVAPVLQGASVSQFEKAQIISSGYEQESATPDSWMVKINRTLPGIGEPLLDMQHRVLGFVSSQKPSPDDPMGATMIVYHPMSQLLSSAEKILKTGGDIRTGWLGVYVDNATGMSEAGVTIENVQQNSPAQKAGLMPGDVLAKYDGKRIRDPRQFIRLVQDTPIGTSIVLDVIRDGQPIALHALIDARQPAENPGRFVFNFPDTMPVPSPAGPGENISAVSAASLAGLETVPLTPQLAAFLQVPDKDGLLVLSVDPQTTLGLAGIQAGDVIISVDGQRVQNQQSFMSYLKSHSRSARSMILKLFRKGAGGITTIELPKVSEPERRH